MRVAMYLRLSSEDGDLKDTGKAESESISNQRGLIENFIRSRSEFSGWEICEFCDDGWSGKNFDRPSFLKMMEQVKQGQINCIVVKDLSRFGRDYLVVGNYISRVFPFMDVRFIAVNDSFDDERYLGKCVYGKREWDMVGNVHTLKHKKEDWIIVDDTHDGIVSKELFKEAASRMKEYKEFELPVSDRNPLRKKVICGTCGYAMSLSNTKNAKYHCRTSHLETQFDCTSESILQADINEMVVTLIRTYAAYAVSLEHLLLLQKERTPKREIQGRCVITEEIYS